MDKLIALLSAKLRSFQHSIDIIVVSLNCDISGDRQRIIDFPNAVWLNSQPLPEILQQVFDKPVVMDRRAPIFLSYDRLLLGIPDESLIMGCYVNDCYESAIWYQGAILAGKSGAAGNIGHMPVHGREDNCRCGKNGYIELYGTGIRLKQLHSLIFSDTPYDELFVRNVEHPLLKDFLHMLAYPLSVEANILDPDFIVLGGTVPTMANFPFQVVEEELRSQTYRPFPSSNLKILPSAIQVSDLPLAVAHYGFQRLTEIPVQS